MKKDRTFREFMLRYVDWTPLFGFDFFISYRRSEASPYATMLERRLSAADFRCFLDDNDAAPGRSLTLRLRWALRRTKVLVLLATPRVTESKWVGQEIELFDKSERDIVPVSIQDGLHTAVKADARWKAIEEKNYLWITEDPNVSASDEPSDRVIGELQKSFKHRRASANLRIALGIVAVALAGIAATAFWQKMVADRERAAAVVAERTAIDQRNLAIQREREASEARDAETLAKNEAKRQEGLAQREARKAKQASIGEAAQRKVATSRQLAAEARVVSQEQPDLGLLLALEGDRIAETVQARRALWEGLASMGYLRRYVRVMGGKVFALAYSPLGDYLAAGDTEGDVRVWRTSQTNGSALPRDHQGAVSSVAFSPSGRRLASASFDRTVVVWDLATRSVVRRLPGPSDSAVMQVAFLGSEDRLVVSDADGAVVTYDLLPDKQFAVRRVAYAPGVTHKLAVDSAGTLIALAGNDGTVSVFTNEEGKWIGRQVEAHPDGTTSIALVSDATILFTGGQHGEIKKWEVATLRERGKALHGDTDAIYSLAATPDGHHLLSAGGSKGVVRWDLREGDTAQPRSLAGHAKAVFALAVHPDGRQFVSGGGDHSIIHWSIESQPHLYRSVDADAKMLFTVAFSPNGKELVVSGATGDVRMLSTEDLVVQVREDSLIDGPVGEVRYSGDGSVILASAMGLYRWYQGNGSLHGLFDGASGSLYRVSVNAAGNKLLTGSPNGEVALWSTEAGRKVWAVKRAPNDARAIAIDPRGVRCVAAGDSNAIQVLDAERGRPIGGPLTGHTLSILDVKFDPTGEILASGSLDGTIRLWNLRTRTLVATLAGRMGPVNGVAFNSQGNLLAGASRNGVVALWDVGTRNPLALLAGALSGTVTAVSFSPDGRWLAATDNEGNVARWSAQFRDWRRKACEIVGGRRLTKEEQLQYLGGQVVIQACDDIVATVGDGEHGLVQ